MAQYKMIDIERNYRGFEILRKEKKNVNAAENSRNRRRPIEDTSGTKGYRLSDIRKNHTGRN